MGHAGWTGRVNRCLDKFINATTCSSSLGKHLNYLPEKLAAMDSVSVIEQLMSEMV